MDKHKGLIEFVQEECANYVHHQSTICPQMNGWDCQAVDWKPIVSNVKNDNGEDIIRTDYKMFLFRPEQFTKDDADHFLKTGENRWKNRKCLMCEGKGCDYFEKKVLPVAANRGCKSSVERQYNQIVGKMLKSVKVKRCSKCGVEVPKRHRMCDYCAKETRREKKREHMQNKRKLGNGGNSDLAVDS